MTHETNTEQEIAKLPELPPPYEHAAGHGFHLNYYYSAEQMRAYAIAAIRTASQGDDLEARARSMFEAQADKQAAPWDRQWEPTKQYWRNKATTPASASEAQIRERDCTQEAADKFYADGFRDGVASASGEPAYDRETDAFEAWAKSARMDMEQHPLHYLFLNEKTYAARQGWKAALAYAADNRDAAGVRTVKLKARRGGQSGRKFSGVGELERSGYIPAGSAAEREGQQGDSWFADTLASVGEVIPLDKLAEQQRAGVPVPSQECYAHPDDQEQWFDCPDDAELMDGLNVGDRYEVAVSHYSVRRTYVVTKVPDDTSDDYAAEIATQPQEDAGNG